MLKIIALKKSEFDKLQEMMPDVILKSSINFNGLYDVIIYHQYLEITYDFSTMVRGYLTLIIQPYGDHTEKIIEFCNEDFYKIEII